MDLPMNRRLLRARPSGIRRFTALARATPGCISLALGEPEFPTPEAVKAEAKAALDQDRTHYPPNNGEPFLLEALARFGERRYGLTYAPEEIIVTAGATEAIYIALTGVLNPGDQVIIPTPAFPLYQEVAGLAGGVCRFLDTSRDGFQITPGRLAPLLNQRTRAIVLNSPANPTGCAYSAASLAAVGEAAAGRPIFILWDGVYRQLAYEDCPGPGEFRELRPQLILADSFSKPYAMTGWRAGWLMADAPVKAQLQKLHQYTVVSASSLVQGACVRALEEDLAPVVEGYRRRRDYACRRLGEMGLPFRRPEGGFYLFPFIGGFGMGSEEFCLRLIREGGLGLVPGACFGCEGFARLSYCCREETLREGLDRLEAFLKGLPEGPQAIPRSLR